MSDTRLQWIPVHRVADLIADGKPVPRNVRYAALVCDGCKPSVALSLLALWERPWSGTALRWAAHALARAVARGINVMG